MGPSLEQSTREPSFQTVRLTRGRHVGPRAGACVMELASMLAGERFSDRPRAVCPVLGMLMRGYNDGIDDRRRQDLYGCASAVVGTNDRSLRRERLEHAERFFGLKPRRRPVGSRRRGLARAAIRYAHRADDAAHAAFLQLVDELVYAGADDRSATDPGRRPAGVAG